MKRFLALIVCLLMFASLCACDNGVTPFEEPQTREPVSIPAPTIKESSIVFGDYYGNSYNNTSLNLGLSLPDDWTVSETSELAELNGMDEEEMLSDFESLMENTQVAYLMFAQDSTGTNNAQLLVENLAVSGNSGISAEDYITLSESVTKTMLEQTGATDIELTPSSISFGYERYAAQIISYTLMDTYIYQEQILFPAGEDYMAILTITGDTETIISRIYPLE